MFGISKPLISSESALANFWHELEHSESSGLRFPLKIESIHLGLWFP